MWLDGQNAEHNEPNIHLTQIYIKWSRILKIQNDYYGALPYIFIQATMSNRIEYKVVCILDSNKSDIQNLWSI